MNIQSVGVAAYASQLRTAGGATEGASNDQPALDQSTLDQSTLDQLVDRAPDDDRGQGAGTDQPATEETPVAGYTADAQRSSRASGSISILA